MNKLKKLAFLFATGSMSLFASAVWAECNPAMLVADTPNEIFEVVDQQFVVDKTTNLMWARCPMGHAWSGSGCIVDESVPQQLTWQDALVKASEIQLGSYSGWRLPNRKELESIVERRCYEPAINAEVFPATAASLYWTSSANDGRADASWVVDFTTGAHRNLIKTELGYVRLVRNYTE